MIGLSESPIVVAPMGGGPSTPNLVVAAANAGALAFLAAGYKTPAEVESQLREVRGRTDAPFGVNLFVPGAPTANSSRVADYARELEPEAARLGVELGTPVWEDDHWSAKVEVLLEASPAVCSFTFGCPDPSIVDAMKQRGIVVMVTVTNVEEAEHAIAAGADALCAQGIEAGAHRGAFVDEADDPQLRTIDLVRALRSRTSIPLVATGGIALPDEVSAALAVGAGAVQAGTAFLRCDESGASALHKAALVDPAFESTALTRAFTGRRARGLLNRFIKDHADAPTAYPEIHHLTRPLRAAAVQQADTESAHLWAGTGHRHARTGSAATIIDWLAGGGQLSL